MMKHYSLFYFMEKYYLCIYKKIKPKKIMKKFFIALSVIMSSMYADAQIQTTHTDAQIIFEENGTVPTKGPRRAPKKNVAPFELYIDEVGKTIRFTTSSEELLDIVIYNSTGQFELYQVFYISPDTDGIISLNSLDEGEYVICVYSKGVETMKKFTIQ